MPIYLLDQRLAFPDPSRADDSGILAVGGDLSSDRLMLAYEQGIFPWYGEGQPILWHSPVERMVLVPAELHVGRTTRKWMRRGTYEVRFDTAFADVLRGCATAPRQGQNGTWLTAEMRAAYQRLFRLGHAHSAEAWLDGRLVGGLYGVVLGGAFFGESMFSHADNASKVAFVTLIERLAVLGYVLVDCQMYTDHLASFGADVIPRVAFQRRLEQAKQVRPSTIWPT